MRDLLIIGVVFIGLLAVAMWFGFDAMSDTSDEMLSLPAKQRVVEQQQLDDQLDAAGIDRETYADMAHSIREAQQ